MTENLNTQFSPAGQSQQNSYISRAQLRHERQMAKMAAKEQHRAARDMRRAERAARPHQDWTFELRIGEKLYTFAWHWLPMRFEVYTPSAPETIAPDQPTQQPIEE